MAPSRIRKALGAVKDQTSIGLAKVSSNSNAVTDLEVAVVKATRHDEHPAEEKHIREILSLTCYSRQYVTACVNTISRRLNKTKNWTVALKTLILVHRLLIEGDSAYEQEIFFATRRGTRLLNLADFRDTSRSDSWDFSAFVRTFSLYLDERLEYKMHGRRNRRRGKSKQVDDEEEGVSASVTGMASSSSSSSSSSGRVTPVRDMKTDRIFNRTQHLQQLLERFLACRPTGAAKGNRIVAVALYPLVKESYQIYYDLTEIMGILIDRFMELDVTDCVKVHDIFSRLSKQFDDLDVFYSWCKSVGIARSSEYPEIEKITQKKLDVMDDFIRDKSALATRSKLKTVESKREPPPPEGAKEEEVEYHDMNGIKALPLLETKEEVEEKEAEIGEENQEKAIVVVEEDREVDFLNLKGDVISSEEHGDKLALALLDLNTTAAAAEAPKWEAFTDNQADWETALVQSASSLPEQKPSLGGGFDVVMLDGMYQQPQPAKNGFTGAGSASSVAFPMAGQRQGMLALPAPPVAGGVSSGSVDPFAASLMVAPPSYVQMSDMEKKQGFLLQEQMMWQQYAKDGMQGQLGFAKLQQQQQQQANPFHMMGGGGG